MNIVKKYNYKPMTRQEENGLRKYNTPDGKRLVSVTTILSKTQDMTHLLEWRANVGEKEATRITTEASGLGSGMHNNIENYILDKPMSGSFMAKTLANLIIKKGISKVSEVWGTEVSLYSAGLYAGTTDLVGLHEGIPAIMDYKNSIKEKKKEWIDDYRAQLAGYALAHDEMYGTCIRKGVVMIATRDAKYQEFVFEGKEFDECIDIWLRRLEQYYNMY